MATLRDTRYPFPQMDFVTDRHAPQSTLPAETGIGYNLKNTEDVMDLRIPAAVMALCLAATTVLAVDFTEPTTDMAFVRVKGGNYIMGDVYGTDAYARPGHRVTVGDLLVGKFEVTFDQYDRFCEETKREKPDDNGWGRGTRPVVNVGHKEALAFAAWLSAKSGKNIRLPSEAEWEFAARGGTTTPYWWGNALGKGNANCLECGSPWGGRQTAPVGLFAANPFGLFDMNGNAYEWVADSWHPDYKGAPRDGSAWLDGGAAEYVSRGGSFAEVGSSLTSFARNWSGPNPARDIGFRLVVEER